LLNQDDLTSAGNGNGNGFGVGASVDLTGNPSRFGTLSRNFQSMQMASSGASGGSLPDSLDTAGAAEGTPGRSSSWRQKLSIRKKKKAPGAALEAPVAAAAGSGSSSGGGEERRIKDKPKKSPVTQRANGTPANHECAPMDIGMSRCVCGNSW